jgi:hypothetical protein
MDCKSASEADRVCEWGEGVQCPNDRKPIFFTGMQRNDVACAGLCFNAYMHHDAVMSAAIRHYTKTAQRRLHPAL